METFYESNSYKHMAIECIPIDIDDLTLSKLYFKV